MAVKEQIALADKNEIEAFTIGVTGLTKSEIVLLIEDSITDAIQKLDDYQLPKLPEDKLQKVLNFAALCSHETLFNYAVQRNKLLNEEETEKEKTDEDDING